MQLGQGGSVMKRDAPRVVLCVYDALNKHAVSA
jgi:hypothetical protein